jgi:hypothetical protein
MVAERKQKTKPKKGAPVEIPVPTKGDFDAALSKVAPPVSHKPPGGKDQPQKRSG